MTPLQQAAQAVIDRWDSPLWKDQPHTGMYIAELSKALAAEQAQEPLSANHRTTGWVAPVNRYAVPVLFNPYTGEPRDVRDVQSDPQGVLIVPPGKAEMLAAKPTVESVTDCMMNLVDRLGHEASDVDARAWEHLLVYAPKQAQAVEPVATVQCVRGVTFGYLDVMQPVGTKLYLHPVQTPAEAQQGHDLPLDLLERLSKTLINLGYSTPEGGMEHFGARIESQLYNLCRGIDSILAQQVAVPAREPLTFDQIDAIENKVYMNTTHKGRPMFEYVNAIIRATEAHHGIGAKQ